MPGVIIFFIIYFPNQASISQNLRFTIFLSLCVMVFFSRSLVSLVLHVLHEEGRHGIGVQRVERPQHRRVALAPLQAPELRQVAQRLRQAATVGPRALRAVGPGERPLGDSLGTPLGSWKILWESWKMWEMEKLRVFGRSYSQMFGFTAFVSTSNQV